MATGTNGQLLSLSGRRNLIGEKLGGLEEGAYADLLLVDRNPLENIDLITNPDQNLRVIIEDEGFLKNTIGHKESHLCVATPGSLQVLQFTRENARTRGTHVMPVDVSLKILPSFMNSASRLFSGHALRRVGHEIDLAASDTLPLNDTTPSFAPLEQKKETLRIGHCPKTNDHGCAPHNSETDRNPKHYREDGNAAARALRWSHSASASAASPGP
ncbi:hypothetical protein [Paraburkholderia sp. SG-MS1]|uniref:hypothetical protein n=1 Tax=Paraburkholderia sp. SG-MS1 TaxID=2023741 RepID=UPI001EEBB90B|nr:hypothetical protein [Paraburkholderia sp. SG-MS1]